MAQTAGILGQLLLMLGLFALTWWLPGGGAVEASGADGVTFYEE